jgi:hypothetical protein
VYGGSAFYFVASFFGRVGVDGSSLYFSPVSFVHWKRIVALNPLFCGIFVIRAGCLLARLKLNAFRSETDRSIHFRFFLFCMGLLAVSILAPERYPFFFAALLPPLAIFVMLLLDDLLALQGGLGASAWVRSRPILAALFVLVGASFALGGWNRFDLCSERDTDRDQFVMIRYLDRFLAGYPRANYYDAIGILPNRAALRYFAGPNDSEANEAAFRAVSTLRPDLIFFTNKLHLLEPKITELLNERYTHLDQGVYGRWEILNPPMPISRVNLPRLSELAERIRKAVGAPIGQKLRFQVKGKGGKVKVIDGTPEQLMAIADRAAIEKISPFTQLIEPPALRVPVLFAFDGEY